MKKIAVALLAGALLACSGDDSSNTSASGGSSTSSTSTGSGGSSGDGGAGGETGNGGAGGGSVGVCPPETICLAVKPVVPGSPISPGRVAVMWIQLSDDGPDPTPFLGYEGAFDPAAARVDIPLAGIAIPPEELLLCQRACNDEAICPCLSDPKVGIGVIVVSTDSNGNGQLELAEVGNYHGFAFMAVGYSATEYIPSPAPFDTKFPDGIDMGVRPYRLMNDGTFDDLYRTMGGEVFDLNICPGPGENCNLPKPNLT